MEFIYIYFLKFYVIPSTSALSRDIEDHNTMFNRDMTFAETKPPERNNASTSMMKINILIAKIKRPTNHLDFAASPPKRPFIAFEPL